MYDPILARRVLNKANKELVAGMSNCTDAFVRECIQKAFNDLTFMYDVLHLDEELKMIDISNNNNV